MAKRLCDLVQVASNDKTAVVLAVKDGTDPFDLIRLGFYGDETMFRMTKEKDNTSIGIFRKGEPPFLMSMGSRGTTVVPEGIRVMRQQICECVHLDFGIVTHGAQGNRFKEAVEATMGPRNLDSYRYFELQKGRDRYSLWVNQSHIALIQPDELDEFLDDRNIKLNIEHTRTSKLASVDVGTMVRADANIEHAEAGKLLMVIENYKDVCEHNFLATESWFHEMGFADESRNFKSKGIEALKQWEGFYLGANITYDVKLCEGTDELHRFMNGEFNDRSQMNQTDWYWDFRRENCTPEALELLEQIEPGSKDVFMQEPISNVMQEAKAKAAERNVDLSSLPESGKGNRKQGQER